MTRSRLLGVVIVLTLGGTALFLGWLLYRTPPDVSEIESIIQAPQQYDGEHVDRLVALGPDSVPAIAEVLTSSRVEFPIVLVSALGEIGDTRGTAPILSFIADRSPYNETETSFATARAILELGRIPNEQACAPIESLMKDENTHPRVRLASAATIAGICQGRLAEDAEAFILTLYGERSEYLSEPNEGFALSELYSALIEVNNQEAENILLDVMEAGAPPHILGPIVENAIEREGNRFSEALARVMNNRDVPLDIRLTAARGLLQRRIEPESVLQASIDQLVEDAEGGGYPQDLVEEARQLREDSR